MSKTLVYFDNGNLALCMDLLAAAGKMDSGGKAYALCINHRAEELAEISAKFDYVLRVHDQRIQPYDAANIARIIEEVHRIHNFDIILLPATYYGRAIAPRAAMRLKTGLTADVTNVGADQLIRPAFDGKILAGIANKDDARPLMATIRPNVFKHKPGHGKNAETINHTPASFRPGGLTLLESRDKPPSKDIRGSRVLVSGGGGVASDFHRLDALAQALGGQVSASRNLVDSSVAKRALQVGQSGKTVSPDLYIALGISGKLQHVVGLKNVKHIIAVNTDKNAPLCSMADIVVEGDAVQFVEKLIEKLNEKLMGLSALS